MQQAQNISLLNALDPDRKARQIGTFTNGFKACARQGVLGAFLSAVDTVRCKIHTGHRLQRYEILPSGSVRLSFANDKTATCDLLIGAEGVHSTIRKQMYANSPEYGDATFSGQYAYRASYSADVLRVHDSEHPALTKFAIVSLQRLLSQNTLQSSAS